jgi:hypothetical protein
MRELPPFIVFCRLDGTFGRVERADCTGWPETRLSFDLRIVEDGVERWQPFDLDVFAAHRGNVEPSLYRTPDGTWLRRAAWHEHPNLTVTIPLYFEVGEWTAHDWLTRNRYEIPSPAPKRRSERRRKGAKEDQCLGMYMKALLAGETPPTPTEIAAKVGCNPGTASRAIKDLERTRTAFAKTK